MDLVSQNLLMTSGGKKSTYIDDVFSTYLYKGTDANQTITNGVDLTEGGLVWLKERTGNNRNQLYDTARGVGYALSSNATNASSFEADKLTAFNNTGFSIGVNDIQNDTGDDYASWTFRKSAGFFTIKQYTGSGSTQSLTHDLGSIPGCIIVKRTDSTADWGVYHRGQNGGVDPEDYRLRLNSTTSQNNDTYWGDTAPTATHFTVGDAHTEVNQSGATYVAYIFAGGASTAATARSVDFDGSADYMVSTDSSYQPGTGDFTIECWVKHDALAMKGIFQLSGSSVFNGTNGIAVLFNTNSGNKRWELYAGGATTQESVSYSGYTTGVWAHLAVVKTGGKTKLYVDGIESISVTDTTNYSTESYLGLGGAFGTQYTFNGQISNFKYTKGQALYTSSFRPPTEPLTTTSQGSTASNVKALCCQSSSATSATVIASALSITGSVTARTDSPFDDPEGFKFGEEGDKNIIKCGSYTGNGNSNGPEINLGFEPQWLLLKNTNLTTEQWFIFDSMRGIISDGTDSVLEASRDVSENPSSQLIDLTPTGFKIKSSDDKVNHESNYVYMALRRPDGLVGKPASAGTDVFAMDAGGSSASGESGCFNSGFPVDFATLRTVPGSSNWFTGARLIGTKYMQGLNLNNAEADANNFTWDSNTGYMTGNYTGYQAWMWKRHAGFDVVAYKGNGVAGRQIPHSLNKTVEMMWVKRRDSAGGNWQVYHKGLNGGTNPSEYSMMINSTNAEADTNWTWYDTAPTSTHFTVSADGQVNSTYDYIAMLFASVDGISKVGYYDGDGSTSHTITTGFTPRFLFIKVINDSNSWYVFDSLRGLGSGNDPYLHLDDNSAQSGTTQDFISTSSTGFTILKNWAAFNGSGMKYIYYAHA